MAEWRFPRKQPESMNRDPVEEEFFTPQTAVSKFVRESIQNSLDAAAGDGPVHVRFYVSGDDGALPAVVCSGWFEGLESHLAASDIDPAPLHTDTMRFVVVEDFGTVGLQGDTVASSKSEFRSSASQRQDFYYFWRNVARTGKGRGERGSWGVGKAVYPASSQIRTFFGWTITQDDRQSLLMGQAVTTLHWLQSADGYSGDYEPYGYFGAFGVRDGAPDFATPIRDATILDSFRKHFGLRRRTEPGLSVVVPQPGGDLADSRSVHTLALAVIEHYAYPILAGDLKVEVEAPGVGYFMHDEESLINALYSLDWSDRQEEDRERLENFLLLLVEILAGRVTRHDVPRREGLGADPSDYVPSDESISRWRMDFMQQRPFGFRIPVLVREKGGNQVLSHFDVYLQREERIRGSMVQYQRQGLTIIDMPRPRMPNVLGILLVHDEPLRELVRASEDPGHTKWETGSKRLGAYIGGGARVHLISRAPAMVLNWLTSRRAERDPYLLADLFPEPEPEAESAAPAPEQSPEEGDRAGGVVEPPPPRPQAVRVVPLANGFSVRRVPGVDLPGSRLVVKAAYQCVGANPFKAWEPYDFELGRDPISVSVHDGEIRDMAGNKVVVRVAGDGFRLDVQGFDGARDVVESHSWLD